MATTVALLLLAGEVLRPFALVMTFAIFTGTLSSIYIAPPLLMYIEKRWPGEDARGARASVPRVPCRSPRPLQRRLRGPLQSGRVTCWSTPTAISAMRRSTPDRDAVLSRARRPASGTSWSSVHAGGERAGGRARPGPSPASPPRPASPP